MAAVILDRTRVLVLGGDFPAGRSALVVRMLAELDRAGFQIVSAEEVKLQPVRMPAVQPKALPAPQTLTYGPQRKGKGGKARRW